MNYDVIVIGAGPAGVSSAIYAKSRGLDVLLLEKNKIGGIIGNVSSVTHYASVDKSETGVSFANKMQEQLEVSCIAVTYENVIGVKLIGDLKEIKTDNNTYYAKAVILANGSTPRKIEAIGAMERYGKTIGLNPFNQGANYKGKDMYVIGGSDGAAKEAIFLSQFAKEVTVVCVEDRLACIAEFKNKIANIENIKVRAHSTLTEVAGEELITRLVFEDLKTKEKEIVASDGAIVFVYAGLIPNTGLYQEIELENGFIQVNEKQETSVSGVYGAGDICVKQVRQVATAVSDGAVAGINACAFVINS